MIAHARRAVPWAHVLTTAVLVAALIGTVGRWPWQAWPLQGTAVGVLAAAAARCLDEPAAEIADTSPHTLRWHLQAHAPAILVLLAVWTGSVTLVGGDMFGHSTQVLFQGIAAVIAAIGLAAWQHTGGHPAPGARLARWIVPATLVLALARPLDEQLAFFPIAPDGPWQRSLLLWTTLATAGLAATFAAATDARWRHWRPVPGRRGPASR